MQKYIYIYITLYIPWKQFSIQVNSICQRSTISFNHTIWVLSVLVPHMYWIQTRTSLCLHILIIVNWTHETKNNDTDVFKWTYCQNIICKMSTILLRLQYVSMSVYFLPHYPRPGQALVCMSINLTQVHQKHTTRLPQLCSGPNWWRQIALLWRREACNHELCAFFTLCVEMGHCTKANIA